MSFSLIPATQEQPFDLAEILGTANKLKYIQARQKSEDLANQREEQTRGALRALYSGGGSALDPEGWRRIAAQDVGAAKEAAAAESGMQQGISQQRQAKIENASQLDALAKQQFGNVLGLYKQTLAQSQDPAKAEAVANNLRAHYLQKNIENGIAPAGTQLPPFDLAHIESVAGEGIEYLRRTNAQTALKGELETKEPYAQAAANRQLETQLARDNAEFSQQRAMADYQGGIQDRRVREEREWKARENAAERESDIQKAMVQAQLRRQFEPDSGKTAGQIESEKQQAKQRAEQDTKRNEAIDRLQGVLNDVQEARGYLNTMERDKNFILPGSIAPEGIKNLAAKKVPAYGGFRSVANRLALGNLKERMGPNQLSNTDIMENKIAEGVSENLSIEQNRERLDGVEKALSAKIAKLKSGDYGPMVPAAPRVPNLNERTSGETSPGRGERPGPSGGLDARFLEHEKATRGMSREEAYRLWLKGK